MELGDAPGGYPQRRHGLGIAKIGGARDLVRRHTQGFGGQLQAVEATGKFDHRRVTALLHLGEDIGDRRVHVLVHLPFGNKHGGEGGFEIGIVGR